MVLLPRSNHKKDIARSSKGRTHPFEGCYLGSSPSLAARELNRRLGGFIVLPDAPSFSLEKRQADSKPD